MMIAVWSPTPFAGRKSSNLLLFALQAVKEEKGEQLIVHVDPEGSGPEHFLLSGHHRSRMVEKKEFGVDFLCRLLCCERITKEAVRSAAYSFDNGKVHILPAGSSTFYEEGRKETVRDLCYMLQEADKLFDNVWVELPAGESEFNTSLIGKADCVIVNLAQSPWETEKMQRLSKLKHAFYLVGAYEQRNIYTVHNLMLLFPWMRGKCAAIPYYPAFLEACCAGDAELFLKRIEQDTEESRVPVFFREAEKTYRRWKERCIRTICGESDDGKTADESS